MVVRRRALPESRSFWIWAERLGLVGRGAGGIWEGRARRARWRAWRVVRGGSSDDVGEVMDLVAGSIWRGRRVNVSSIVEDMVEREV